MTDKNSELLEGKWLKTKKFLFRVPMTDIGIKKPWKSEVTAEDLFDLSPLMFYITEEGDVKIYNNVKTGRYTPKDSWGRDKDFENLIEGRKILQWNYDGQKIPIYIHYEKETYGYPHEPKLDAKSVTQTLRTIQLNYKEYEQRGSIWDMFGNADEIKNLLTLIGGIVGIVVVTLWLFKTFDLSIPFFGFSGGEVTTTTPPPSTPSVPSPVVLE